MKNKNISKTFQKQKYLFQNQYIILLVFLFLIINIKSKVNNTNCYTIFSFIYRV